MQTKIGVGIRDLLKQTLEEMVEQADEVVGVIAVTTDGHIVAQAARIPIPSKRLAAMGSTLMSLGNTVTKELQMGKCRNIISENEKGVVIFMSITPRIVLVSLTDSVASLGTLLSVSRRYVTNLNAKFDDMRNPKR